MHRWKSIKCVGHDVKASILNAVDDGGNGDNDNNNDGDYTDDDGDDAGNFYRTKKHNEPSMDVKIYPSKQYRARDMSTTFLISHACVFFNRIETVVTPY